MFSLCVACLLPRAWMRMFLLKFGMYFIDVCVEKVWRLYCTFSHTQCASVLTNTQHNDMTLRFTTQRKPQSLKLEAHPYQSVPVTGTHHSAK